MGQNQVDKKTADIIAQIQNENARNIMIEAWLLEDDKEKLYEDNVINKIIELEKCNSLGVHDINHELDLSPVNIDMGKYDDEGYLKQTLQSKLQQNLLPNQVKKLCCDEQGKFHEQKFNDNLATIQNVMTEIYITDEQARQGLIDDNSKKNKEKFEKWKGGEPLTIILRVDNNHFVTCVIEGNDITVIDPLSDNPNINYGEVARDIFIKRYNAIYGEANALGQMFNIVGHNVKTQNDSNSCGPISVEVTRDPKKYMERKGFFTSEETRQMRLEHLKILSKDKDLKASCDICEEIYNGTYNPKQKNEQEMYSDMLKLLNNNISKFINKGLQKYKEFKIAEVQEICKVCGIKTCKDLQDQLVALSQYKPKANTGIKK